MPESADAPPPASQRLAILETCLIFLLFFLFAGWPPPDVNEAHYLAKAKHYWNPDWCRGDLFLESADAHLVFYWTFGWITRWCSLPATAWIGRVLTWALMAWSWRRLSFALLPRRFLSLLTAALMLVLVNRLHMAGEWIVGGVEAKGFSFVLLFLALERLTLGHWKSVYPLLGAASSFHVLIGGWSLVAAAAAWLVCGRGHVTLRQLAPSLALAVALALPGIVPALLLTADAPREVARDANIVYVYERLPHHLVIHRLPKFLIARQAALLLAWAGLAYAMRKHAAVTRLNAFVGGAVAIALTGILIDQTLVNHAGIAAGLLRFYWYRLSDAMLPVGAALAGAAFAYRQEAGSAAYRPRGAALALSLLAAAALLQTYASQRGDMRPRGVQQAETRLRIADDAKLPRYHDWVAACRWIAEKTPDDACFLTPRWQQSFKWYAGRCEIVNFKDVPQDARGIMAWRKRLRDVYRPIVSAGGFTVLDDKQLRELAARYDADYLMIDKRQQKRGLPFPLVYPIGEQVNRSFAVYRIPKLPETAAGDSHDDSP